MTINEAIEMAKIPLDCEDASEKVKDFANMCISALEKQIPKIPIFDDALNNPDEEVSMRCSQCNAVVDMFGMLMFDYCPKCGQKIKWVNDETK